MNAKQALDLLKKSAKGWVEDRAPSQGAALSYYTVFSIAPLLLIVISVAGLVFGQEAARGAIVGQLQGLIGEDSARAVEGLLQSVAEPKKGVLSTIIGLLVLLVGATTVLAELQSALDRIWRAPTRLMPSGIVGWFMSRIVSFGMILGIGFLLLVSLVFSAMLSALDSWWSPFFGGWEVLATVLNVVVSYALVTALFALIYKFMPHVHIQWRDVLLGAAVTALFFTIGKTLIGLYIGKSGVASGFGAAGSLVIVLVWVYYSAQVFLFGAEFTAAYARTFGSLKGVVDESKEEGADKKASPASKKPAAASSNKRPATPAPIRPQPVVVQASGVKGHIQHRPGRAIGMAMLAGVVSALAAKAVIARRHAHEDAMLPAGTYR
jgi:membrane protein